MSSLPIRILHIVDDFSTANTGVTNTVRQITQWQAQRCDWVGVHTIGLVDIAPPEGVEVISRAPHPRTPFWRYPVGGVAGMVDLIKQKRVTHLHIHEFWRAGFAVGMRAARKAGIPVVLSPHGLTSPWALRKLGWKNRLKKSLYWNLFGRYCLADHAALHAITPLELDHMQAFFGRRPQVIIPNAIDLADPIYEVDNNGSQSPARRIVFLGRLHPIKGVETLIKAFSKARLNSDWELIIAGPEEMPDYVAKLKALAGESTRSASIHFVGPCYGAEKRALLRDSWVVVVPSFTEVIGMVNLESASLHTPTITTTATGLTDWAAAGGVLVEPEVDGVCNALEKAAAWTLEERLQRGRKARAQVEAVFSLEAVGEAWLNFYAEIQGNGVKPR